MSEPFHLTPETFKDIKRSQLVARMGKEAQQSPVDPGVYLFWRSKSGAQLQGPYATEQQAQYALEKLITSSHINTIMLLKVSGGRTVKGYSRSFF